MHEDMLTMMMVDISHRRRMERESSEISIRLSGGHSPCTGRSSGAPRI